MENFGFFRVAAVKPQVRVGDIGFNLDRIKHAVLEADAKRVRLAVFPELSVTGYTCADLFLQPLLLEKALDALSDLRKFSENVETTFVVGLPISSGGALYNCAAVLSHGVIAGLVPKKHIPNYSEFYEKRWFRSGSDLDDVFRFRDAMTPISANRIFQIDGVRFGIEICEDLWVPVPPSCGLATHGAEIILNLSATDEVAGKHAYLLDLIRQQSARCRCAYVYASAGAGESSTDLAFSGNCIVAENGTILSESPRFTEEDTMAIADIDVELLRNDRIRYNTFSDNAAQDTSYSTTFLGSPGNGQYKVSDPLEYRSVNPMPFVEKDETRLRQRCEEISSIQAWGLARRLRAIHCDKAVIGISGGLDSTLALLVTVKAFDNIGLDRKNIYGVTMPGFGTTERTRGNAWKLMEHLEVTPLEIPINDAVQQHFRDIHHNPAIHDATYENSQARERTQILMDLANQTGGIVIGTGDLSELALGWCTYNGDHMSMYGVNTSIPKTLVRDLVRGYALSSDNDEVVRTLTDIIDTPISPELLPAASDGTIAQKTEDLVGPYELHDFFLHAMLRHSFGPAKIYAMACKAFKGAYEPEEIRKWLRTFYRRFFSQQFKRSCMPDGVKVGSVCLSPRGDWRMPSDAPANLWLEEVDKL